MVMEPFAERYYSYIESAHAAIVGVSGELQRAGLAQFIKPWFATFYTVVDATLPLIRFCLQELEKNGRGKFDEQLREYYLRKLEDEADHDEWLLKDLTHLGLSKEFLRQTLPPSAITALIGSQYYLIAHHHPALCLGYVGFLEGYPANPEDASTLSKTSGTPEEAWSTYRFHVDLDVHHRQELEEILNAVPEEGLRQGIIANGIRSGEFYCEALESMLVSATEEAS
jgi:hypothetical protein